MPAYNIFFFACLFFVIGILLFNLQIGFVAFILVFLVFTVGIILFLYLRERKFLHFALLSIFVLMGSFYSSFFNLHLERNMQEFLKRGIYYGLVRKVIPAENESKVIVKVKNVNLLLEFDFVLDLKEGEIIYFDTAHAKIKKAPPYFLKDGIVWSFKNPTILDISKSNSFLSRLLLGKEKIVTYFSTILPQKESSFLSGLLVGGRNNFPPEFDEAMKKSGTTHLVALSGYNISIIVIASLGFFLLFCVRGVALFFTLLFILFFVLMTGAEASVVRAAFIGVGGIFAREIGRLYNPRNVIMLTAVIMLIFNPNLIVWDLGFELSFLAFLGITYLRPILFLRENKWSEKGVRQGIYDIFLTTLSAQIMVFPLLLLNFGYFSFASFLANVLVVWLIPPTMFLGFLNLALGMFFNFLGLVSGWLLFPLLKIETFIIEFFGAFNLGWNVGINPVFVLVYYCLLILLILWRKRFLKSV